MRPWQNIHFANSQILQYVHFVKQEGPLVTTLLKCIVNIEMYETGICNVKILLRTYGYKLFYLMISSILPLGIHL